VLRDEAAGAAIDQDGRSTTRSGVSHETVLLRVVRGGRDGGAPGRKGAAERSARDAWHLRHASASAAGYVAGPLCHYCEL